MAKGVSEDFKISVTIDTSGIYLKTTETNIQNELDKYKLLIRPTVNWTDIDRLKSELAKLSKTQLINLTIDESNAIRSVQNISATLSKNFSDAFTSNIGKIITDSQQIETAMKNIGSSSVSTYQALNKINLLMDNKDAFPFDKFARRLNQLSTAFANFHAGFQSSDAMKNISNDILHVITQAQKAFDGKPLNPVFNFKPDAIVSQMRASIKVAQEQINNAPELQLELRTVPKFKIQKKDGIDQNAMLKIPAVIDPAESLPYIKDGIAALNATIRSSGEATKLNLPISLKRLKDDLAKIPIDIAIIGEPENRLNTILGLLKEIKKNKNIPIATDNKNAQLHNELAMIYKELSTISGRINEMKEKGLHLDEQAIKNANTLTGAANKEANAQERKLAAVEKARKAYFAAYKNELNYTSGDKKVEENTKKELHNNTLKTRETLMERIGALEKSEQDNIMKLLLLEEERVRLENRAKREDKHNREADALSRLRKEAGGYKTQIDDINASFDRYAKTANALNSPQYQRYGELSKLFYEDFKTISTGKDAGGNNLTADQYNETLARMRATKDEMVAINKEIKNAANNLSTHAKDADKFATLNQRLTSYLNKYGNELRQNTELYQRFITLQNKMNNKSIGYFDAKTEFAGLTQEARKLGLEVDTIWKKLKRTFAQRGRGWLSNQGWMLISRAFRDIRNNVIEVDTAMTELKKVTQATELQYNQFLDNAKIRAEKLGATLVDVVSATSDFARLGFNIGDASILADTALIYKNVGDDVDDIDTASKAIISTMQGFNIEANNSMQIVDKFNEVANNYASSAGDIGEITKRSAAAMKVAGASLDETIALGVTANEVVQDADIIGTAMKTMSMRLRSSKSDMESAGEDTDGMADSVSKLRNEIKALTGVDIMLDEDTFKGPYDMLMEIGEVWDQLSDISRANVGELLFGKRQANVGFAILENYERAQEILETSQNSAGSAQHEQEIYLTSIQGKLDQLEATWQSMSTNLLDSSLAKGAIDSLNGILNLLNGIVDAIGTLPLLIGAASAALIDFGKDAGKDCALLLQVA